MLEVVLAIDPGRMKCGVAVVRRTASGFGYIYQGVIESDSLPGVLPELVETHKPQAIVIGDGTASSNIISVVKSLGIADVKVVDEKNTTLLARRRFWEANPPRGLRRLIPVSMQTPNRPYDDYVAIILAERLLVENS